MRGCVRNLNHSVFVAQRKPHREGGVDNSEVQLSDGELRGVLLRGNLRDDPPGANPLDVLRVALNFPGAPIPLARQPGGEEHSTGGVHFPD